MQLFRFVLAFAALVGAAPAHAIVGGTEAAPDMAAHVVMIVSDRGSFCSATVLAPSLLLTAAHCVRPGADYRLLTYDAAGAPVLAALGHIAAHPQYDPAAYAKRHFTIDLALVGLVKPLDPGHQPVALPSAAEPGIAGASYRIAGYGLSAAGAGKTGGHLREETLAGLPPLSKIQLRLGDPGGRDAGSCQGDSGGPVIRQSDQVLVGVLASAVGQDGKSGCGGKTGVALVGTALDWIRDTAAAMGSPLP